MDRYPHPGSAIAARLARRLPFFYGWVIVYVGFIGVFMMGATAFWGLPVFVGPMHDDTDWATTSIFGALTIRFIVGAIGGLFLGPLADRRGGAAMLLLVGVVIDAASMAAIRWVSSPLEFILLYGVIGGAGNTGLRITQMSLIPKWFVQRRGRAVGYASVGGGMSAFVMVPAISWVVAELGWRDAWTALAAFMLVLVLPLVPFSIRAPEDIGQHPDGRSAEFVAQNPPSESERSFSLREVVRSWVFWVLLASVVFGSYSLQTGTIIMVPYFEDIGFSSGVAASAISIYGLFSIGARFVWGYAADRLRVRRALMIQALLTCVGAFLMLQIEGRALLYFVAAYMGVMIGGFPTLAQLVWPEFFGRAHIGGIIGLVQFFATIIGSTGPFIAGFMFDQTGTYSSALWVVVFTWFACALAVYAARPRQVAEASSTVSSSAS